MTIEEAIQELESRKSFLMQSCVECWDPAMEMALQALNAQRTGKWTREKNYGMWKCSVCGCKVKRDNPLKGNIWNYNYCPNCGCRMVENE